MTRLPEMTARLADDLLAVVREFVHEELERSRARLS